MIMVSKDATEKFEEIRLKTKNPKKLAYSNIWWCRLTRPEVTINSG